MDNKRLLDHVLDFFAQKTSALNVLVSAIEEDLSKKAFRADLTQMKKVVGAIHNFLSHLNEIRSKDPLALVAFMNDQAYLLSSSEFAEMVERLWRELPYAPEQPAETAASAPAEPAPVNDVAMVKAVVAEIIKEMIESGKLQEAIAVEAIVRKVIEKMFADGSLQKAVAGYLRQTDDGG